MRQGDEQRSRPDRPEIHRLRIAVEHMTLRNECIERHASQHCGQNAWKQRVNALKARHRMPQRFQEEIKGREPIHRRARSQSRRDPNRGRPEQRSLTMTTLPPAPSLAFSGRITRKARGSHDQLHFSDRTHHRRAQELEQVTDAPSDRWSLLKMPLLTHCRWLPHRCHRRAQMSDHCKVQQAVEVGQHPMALRTRLSPKARPRVEAPALTPLA